VIDVHSYKNVTRVWLEEIRHHVNNPCIILVGTKVDLRSPKIAMAESESENSDIVVTSDNEQNFDGAKDDDENDDDEEEYDETYEPDIDSQEEGAVIRKKDGQYLARKISAETYIEISANKGEGPKEVFDKAIHVSLASEGAFDKKKCSVM